MSASISSGFGFPAVGVTIISPPGGGGVQVTVTVCPFFDMF
jgi:hypothetical protein